MPDPLAPADVPTELSLVVGDRVTITLPGLGTAGYRWEGDLTGDSGVVSLGWNRGTPATEAARGGRAGASSPERVEISATAPGRAAVRLVQRRPWEASAPRAEHVVVIDVRAP